MAEVTTLARPMARIGAGTQGTTRPNVYTIAAHRGFAEALVAGLIPRFGKAPLGLAHLTLLLPSRRAARTLTEAFLNHAARGRGAETTDAGLLLPRMVVIGELDDDFDEGLGPLLDPLADDAAGDLIPPAVAPLDRWLRLAALLAEDGGAIVNKPATDTPTSLTALRRARAAAQTLDRLGVEDITPETLLSPDLVALVGEQAAHWIATTRDFLRLAARWRAECAKRGVIDPAARRNRLFTRAAMRWRAAPPADPIIAAGITSAAPALARLLKVVSTLPQGAVILPDLDIHASDAVWTALGHAGVAPADSPDDTPFGREEALTHPQYHLKLLLNRMGVARGEVRPWHRSGASAAPPARSRAIANLFLPAAASAGWVDLPEPQRRLAGVKLMESAHPGEEAQAIAILIREALEEPDQRVALVTPDRGLAERVVAHLERWGIAADDSAGQSLTITAAGRVPLLLAEVLAQAAAPVPLVALLSHPLVNGGEGRADWLDHVRRLDLLLRGPRPAPGLAALTALVRGTDDPRFAGWWDGVTRILAPLFALPEVVPLVTQLATLTATLAALCGEGLWRGADGRALAAHLDALTEAAEAAGTRLARAELAGALREAMTPIAVRPPWGGHPRVAILGLLEARMARADLIICGGLVEGVWPATPSPEPMLPPALLRHLGVPAAEFRIGLAAHDLASALGAPRVILSYARRDAAGPVMPSRFVLRVRAMLGETLAKRHETHAAIELARAIDLARAVPPHPRPQPMPSPEQRRVPIAVTALDRLRGDPYQFYAAAILGLRPLDRLDAAPSPAWRGTVVHAILDAWHKMGHKMGSTPAALPEIVNMVLGQMHAHPLIRALWRPRLLAGLGWIAAETIKLAGEGRGVLATEISGAIIVQGLRLHGRADRIDRLAGGGLAIVDYKTGVPPSAKRVTQGFALQLGLIGLIAQGGGFAGVACEPQAFEYWSLARGKNGFGVRKSVLAKPEPATPSDDSPGEAFLAATARFLDEAIARWLLGNEPFTARLNPDLKGYNDYDHLMRLDEWRWRLGQASDGSMAP